MSCASVRTVILTDCRNSDAGGLPQTLESRVIFTGASGIQATATYRLDEDFLGFL